MSPEQVTTSKRVIHNTLFNVITSLTNAVINFLLIRFFLGRLGEEKYGVWVIIGSIFAYRGILDLGLNSAINRYIPVYLAKGDKDGVHRVINTSFFFFLVTSIILILASILISQKIGIWFGMGPELAKTAGQLVLVTGFCAAVVMPLQLYTAVLSSLQRYDIIGLTIITLLLIRVALLIVLLLHGFGLIAMGLIYGLSEIIIRIIQIIFAKRLMPDIVFSSKGIDIRLLGQMVSYSINTLLYVMSALIIYKTNDVIIGIFLSTKYVARFSVAAVSVMLLSQIQVFTAAVKPAVSDLDARNDTLKLKEISFLTQKYTLLLLIPAVCFLVIMGKEFLSIWVGSKFGQSSVINEISIVLAILAIGHGLRLSQYSNFMVLVGKGEHKIFGFFAVVTAVCCVLFSIAALKFFNLGLIGVAWSNFLPLAVISGFILPFYFNYKMQISIRESIKYVWRPAVIGSLPGVVFLYGWKYLNPPDCWFELVAVVGLGAVITLLGSWFLSMKKTEHERFLQVLGRSCG